MERNKNENIAMLNQLGIEYYNLLQLEKEENEGKEEKEKKEKLETRQKRFDIWVLCIEIFTTKNQKNLIGDIMEERVKNFNPDKGDLYPYIKLQLPYARIDAYAFDTDQKNNKSEKVKSEDGETDQQPKRKKMSRASADDADGEFSKPDSDGTTVEKMVIDNNVDLDAINIKFITLLLDFKNKVPGKADSKTRQQKLYSYGRYFTERLVSILQMTDYKKTLELYIEQEQAIFQTINCKFLDFFMSEQVRKIPKLYITQTKRYEEIDATDLKTKNGEKHIVFPLSPRVHIKFIEKDTGEIVKSNHITGNEQAFLKFLKAVSAIEYNTVE